METNLTEIREQQKNTWNTFSSGWKKWDDFTMNFLKPMGDAIITALDIQESDTVLDIASGTGEPGLTIATMARKGKVTAVDLAEKMLETAKGKAAEKGISNFETQSADACALPFENDSFTKVSCRMGFMFFPDMQLAADEMYRVLKPGGKMAASVWFNPQKNPWITLVMGVISRNLGLTPPPPEAPGMFRCAQPGLMKMLLQNAGFTNIREEEISGKVQYENFDSFWTNMNEVAAPVVGALSKAGDDMKEKIKREVQEAVQPYATGNGIELQSTALVISGSK